LETGSRLSVSTSQAHTAADARRFADLAAACLNLEPSRVVVEPVDTQAVPDSGPSTAATPYSVVAPLIEQCAAVIQKKRFTQSLPIAVKRSLKPPGLFERCAWAGTVVEIDLDPVSLQPACRGIWLVADVGAVGSSVPVLEQLVLQAYRYAAWGGILQEYGLFTPPVADRPPIHIHIIEENKNPPKAFDALADNGLPAAYVSAVSQASGLYLDRFPVTPEVVQQCLEAG
jgi:CO/xanthine dehydrogenase Mo-binding subunit